MANKQEMLEGIAAHYGEIINAMDMPAIVSSLNGIVNNLTVMFDDSDSDPNYLANTLAKCREITEGLQSVIDALGEQFEYTMNQIKGGDASSVNTD